MFDVMELVVESGLFQDRLHPIGCEEELGELDWAGATCMVAEASRLTASGRARMARAPWIGPRAPRALRRAGAALARGVHTLWAAGHPANPPWYTHGGLVCVYVPG